MENNLPNNLPVINKRIWSIVRIVYFLFWKGVAKGKLLTDLSMVMKRGKIAGKSMIRNIMFHPHPHQHNSISHEDFDLSSIGAGEYEFSCSNTPNYRFFPVLSNRRHHRHSHFFACAQLPATEEDEGVTAIEMQAVMEMLSSKEVGGAKDASPALPGFGRTPTARQVRITDSPFPFRDEEDHSKVDEEAEKFIRKFYQQLRNQKS